jgi:phospho-N-acetylmuramoyl-pentapeptide-transferase
MLFHLLYEFGADELGFLRVFRYTSTRLLAAAITALLLSFVIGPWFIERLKSRQIGETIREDGPQTHKKKAGTPTMGGSLIVFCLAVSTLLWCDLRNHYVWLALSVTVLFGAIGFADDYEKVAKKNKKGISGGLRLGLEFLIAGAAMAYLFYSDLMPPDVRLHFQVPFTNFYEQQIVLPAWFYCCLGACVVVGAANAVNLTDGLDGLAIGPSIMNAGTFMIFAYIAGVETTILFRGGEGPPQEVTIAEYLHVAHIDGMAELAIFAAALFGTGIGFLWYNAYPAQVFMGDVGSLALGGAIGMLAVLTKNELVLLIVGGLFVVETLSVIIQRGVYKATKKPGPDGKMVGKRVFLMAPIHHHYEKKGWDEPKIIVRFWLVSALLALVALGTLKFR